MSKYFTRAHSRIGIVPRLLCGYLVAAAIAVAVMLAWMLHVAGQAEYQSAQSRLDTGSQMALNGMLWQGMLAGLAVMLAVTVIDWLMLRAILRPLQALAGAVRAISDGHFDIVVPCIGHAGQIGAIGRAVEASREKAQRATARETREAADRADKIRRQDAMDRLTQDFGTSMSGVLSDLIREVASMRTASREMVHTAGRARSSIASTATVAQTSLEDLSPVTASAEALTAGVGEIARQVEARSTPTPEIAVQVRSMAGATEAAIRTMHDASAAAERSRDSSQTVRLAADAVARISSSLREEVDHFVTAMRTSQQSGKRRKYERIPGLDTVTRLWTVKQGPGSAAIIDISLGGAGLACDWRCEPGTEILVDIPGVGVPVSSRVINARGGVLAVAFRQDPETLTHVGQAIDRINAKANGAKANAAKTGVAQMG
jgi:hypothetical protein